MPAPKPTVDVPEAELAPSVRMIGAEFPVDGRQVGLIIDEDTAPAEIQGLVTVLDEAGTQPLLIAPSGKKLGGELPGAAYVHHRGVDGAGCRHSGRQCRASPEVDKARDARVRQGAKTIDPGITTLLDQMFRHAKVIGVVEGAKESAQAVGITLSAPGIVSGSADNVARGIVSALSKHRVWERFA